MKLGGDMYLIILNNLWKFELDPDVRPDIRPDIRFDHTYEQNCTKFAGSGQFALIMNSLSFGNDPLAFDPVIQPDIRPDLVTPHPRVGYVRRPTTFSFLLWGKSYIIPVNIYLFQLYSFD